MLNLCMNYTVHVSCTMWKIKNQPSNSTSCRDSALHLLVLVAGILCWGLQVTPSFWIWGCVLRGFFWRARSRSKGIEDFNLENWSQVPLVLASPNMEEPKPPTFEPQDTTRLVRDDPKLLDDGGETPKSQGRGWWFSSRVWNLLSTWHKTCHVVNCLMCFGAGMSAFCLKKKKKKKRHH